MDKSVVRTMVDAITNNGVTRFNVASAGNTTLVEVGSDSTKVYFDDGNECLWYIKVSANVQPWDNRPMSFGVISYADIATIYVPSDAITIMKIAQTAGYEITDDVTEWIKSAGSQAGLYPAQSYPREDKDGERHLYNNIPTCK